MVEAEYDVPFQGHTSIGPAHAIADPSNDQMTIYSNDMKSYGLRNGVAQFLQMPRDRVRVVWMDGPQAFGRTAAEDAGFEAAFLAKELGRPVRMQWTRQEETAWDTKGPAYAFKMRGGLDAQGNLVALDYEARAADHNHLGYNEPDSVLIAQLTGQHRGDAGSRQRRHAGRDVRASPTGASPARRRPAAGVGNAGAHGQSARSERTADVTFASESFIDELAVAAKADPVEFRLKLLKASPAEDSGFKRARSIAVIKAAAEKYGWDARPSPKPRGTGNILTGRGIAYAFRSQTVVAQIAEVEVNRLTGHVWVKRVGVRPRLRSGGQPAGAAPDARMRHAALAEPRALRGSAVRYREGHERRLAHVAHAHACRRARAHRHRAGERRPESEAARSAALRRRRNGLQAGAGGGRQRYLRRNRRAHPEGPLQGLPRTRSLEGGERLAAPRRELPRDW